MTNKWKEEIDSFMSLSDKYGVRMLMVGGGAVNFHGYQRHSADVDFWIDTSDENLEKLIKVFNEMGYTIESFPDKVKNQEQNISVKFSPGDLNLELITRFSISKSFDEAYRHSELATVNDKDIFKWNVLSLEDLIDSKIRAGRNKDLLDVQELKRIHNLK